MQRKSKRWQRVLRVDNWRGALPALIIADLGVFLLGRNSHRWLHASLKLYMVFSPLVCVAVWGVFLYLWGR